MHGREFKKIIVSGIITVHMVSFKLGSGNEMTITGQYYYEIRIAECNE